MTPTAERNLILAIGAVIYLLSLAVGFWAAAELGEF